MLLGKAAVTERLLKRRYRKLDPLWSNARPQLLDHLQGLLPSRRDIFARMDRLERRRDVPDLGRRYVAE
jgi:hypothetical protein